MNENDLRVIKTRESIESAFLDLLGEKDFAHITVTEILSRCRIAKGTFYYHYRDKYDLAEQIIAKHFASFDQLFEASKGNFQGNGTSLESMAGLATGIAASYAPLSSIHTPEFDARDKLHDFLRSRFLELMQKQTQLGEISNPSQVAAFLASIVATQIEMVISGESQTGSQFIESLRDLIACISLFQSMEFADPDCQKAHDGKRPPHIQKASSIAAIDEGQISNNLQATCDKGSY